MAGRFENDHEGAVPGSLRVLPAAATPENAPTADTQEQFKDAARTFEIGSGIRMNNWLCEGNAALQMSESAFSDLIPEYLDSWIHFNESGCANEVSASKQGRTRLLTSDKGAELFPIKGLGDFVPFFTAKSSKMDYRGFLLCHQEQWMKYFDAGADKKCHCMLYKRLWNFFQNSVTSKRMPYDAGSVFPLVCFLNRGRSI